MALVRGRARSADATRQMVIDYYTAAARRKGDGTMKASKSWTRSHGLWGGALLIGSALLLYLIAGADAGAKALALAQFVTGGGLIASRLRSAASPSSASPGLSGPMGTLAPRETPADPPPPVD